MGYYAKRMWGGASGVIQDSSLKLWLDAGNPLSYPVTGTLWSDLSGNGNNGTMVNGVAYSTANGGVMSFDGVDDYVDVPYLPIGNSTTWTISCFCKVGATSNSCIYSETTTSSNNPFISVSIISGGVLELVDRNSSSIGLVANTTSLITRNVWTKIDIIRDSITTAKVYINGIESVANRRTFPNPGDKISNKTTIGRRIRAITDGAFNGQLNDILIYNRALTAEEVNQNFQATRNKYGI